MKTLLAFSAGFVLGVGAATAFWAWLVGSYMGEQKR